VGRMRRRPPRPRPAGRVAPPHSRGGPSVDAMRVLLGGIVHETNTYATALWGTTELSDFTKSSGQDMLERHRTARTCIGGMMSAAADLGLEIVPTFFASAAPGGTISEQCFAALKSELVGAVGDALRAAPIDAVCLNLHGAGVYSEEQHRDLEAEVGRSMRELIGTATPMVCTLDLHGNIGDEMASYFDVMLGFHKFPHTDQFERGDEVMRLVPGLVAGTLRPACHVEHLPMLMPSNSTDDGWPMSRANDFAASLEQRAGMVDCTIFHGFQFCDIEHVGVHIVVITEDDPLLASAVAKEMGSWIWEHRREFELTLENASEVVTQALSVPHSEYHNRPVVIHETSDNPGGGATGDATFLLRAMLAAGFKHGEAAFGYMVDPEAVQAALAAGPGATLPRLILGGKMDPSGMHGDPLELSSVHVVGLSDGKFTLTAWAPGLSQDLGPMAHLRVSGVDVLVSSRRGQTFCPAVFALHGIDIATKRCIGLKSTAHFRAGFTLGPSGNTCRILTADTMGLTTKRPGVFIHHRCARPMWPADADAAPDFVIGSDAVACESAEEEHVVAVAKL
jgi:microcystin degradation protein MlrC